MGQERWKYLDMANMSYAAGDFISCNGYLSAFLETIVTDSEAGKQIKEEFDHIEIDRRKKNQELESKVKDLGYLEQRDILTRGKEQIEIEAIYNKKAVCWTISMQHGLFNA